MLQLRIIPMVVSCLIWEHLDLESLASLYASFDRNIQRQLSTPRMIRHLVIHSRPTGSEKYFLQSLRDVGYMRLSSNAKWTLKEFLLFQALNPSELDLRMYSMSLKIFEQMRVNSSLQDNIQDSDETNFLRRNFKGPMIPNFSLLTPNLQRLRLGDPGRLADNPWGLESPSIEAVCLPPTLRHLRLDLVSRYQIAGIWQILPSDMLSIHLDSTVWDIDLGLITLFQNQHSITSLTITSDYLQDLSTVGPGVALPSSLTELNLSRFRDSFPTSLCSILKKSNLEKLSLGLSSHTGPRDSIEYKQFSLASCMPPSLRSLRLVTSATFHRAVSYISLVDLPLSLTDLALSVGCYDPDLIASIASLHNLTSLSLEEDRKSGLKYHMSETPDESTPEQHAERFKLFLRSCPLMMPVHIATLPKCLQTIKLDVSSQLPLSEEKLRALPASVSKIILRSSCLSSQISAVTTALPHCSLIIEEPLNIWEDQNFSLLSLGKNKLLPQELDCQAFERAIYRHYQSFKVYFKLSWFVSPRNEDDRCFPETETLIWRPSSSIIDYPEECGYSPFPAYNFIKSAFPNLRKLVVCPAPGTGGESLFTVSVPSFLEHLEISSLGVHYLGCSLPSSLTHIWSDGQHRASNPELLKLSDFPNLTHVYAPRWNFWVQSIGEWTDPGMDMFVAGIIGLEETLVDPFLISCLSEKTRRNASLNISYYENGRFMQLWEQGELNIEKEAGSVLTTDEILKQLLLAPMPDFEAEFPLEGDPRDHESSTEYEAIGKVVSGLKNLGPKKHKLYRPGPEIGQPAKRILTI